MRVSISLWETFERLRLFLYNWATSAIRYRPESIILSRSSLSWPAAVDPNRLVMTSTNSGAIQWRHPAYELLGLAFGQVPHFYKHRLDALRSLGTWG